MGNVVQALQTCNHGRQQPKQQEQKDAPGAKRPVDARMARVYVRRADHSYDDDDADLGERRNAWLHISAHQRTSNDRVDSGNGHGSQCVDRTTCDCCHQPREHDHWVGGHGAVAEATRVAIRVLHSQQVLDGVCVVACAAWDVAPIHCATTPRAHAGTPTSGN